LIITPINANIISIKLYRVGKIRFTVVRMEKDMQIMIIKIALLITILILIIRPIRRQVILKIIQ
jgi:hypothetical protein